jgi:hypothetical protein
MARKVGKLGERKFAALVSDYERGATCNASEEDEHGWDHVVEFDHRPLRGLPADLARALPACFVQTKTRLRYGNLKVTMKLSNALAFTRSNNPCFVVIVSAPAGEPVRYHAVHWWDVLMTRALKRARELHRDGVSEDELHKREISFTMRESDAREPEALVGWMEATVRQLGPDYTVTKALLRDSLGFDAKEINGSIKFSPNGTISDLIDHQLGLTPSIGVEGVEINQRRFGIDIPLPIPDGPPIFARMHANPAAICEVRARGPDGESFILQGELLVPVIPGLAEDQRKYRVRTPIFDLIWTGSAAKFQSQFDTATLRPPAELEKLAKFIGWGGAGEIDVMVTIGDDRVFGGMGSMDPLRDAPAWRRLAGPLGTLARLAEGAKTVVPLISIDQVLKVEWLDNLYSVVAATETTLNADVACDEDFPTFDHAISFALLSVGDWAFGTLIRLPLCSIERGDTSLRVTFGQATLLETYVFPTSDLTLFERLKADYSRHATRPGAFAIDNMLLHLAGEA